MKNTVRNQNFLNKVEILIKPENMIQRCTEIRYYIQSSDGKGQKNSQS